MESPEKPRRFADAEKRIGLDFLMICINLVSNGGEELLAVSLGGLAASILAKGEVKSKKKHSRLLD